MKARIIFWSITSALAGFLFGFDTVVISGAEQTIQKLWGLSAGMHGLAMGAALYGTVLGSLFGGWPTDKFGRKPTLLFIGLLYILSAVGCAFANDVGVFIAARVIGGIGIGISTVVAPLYISEIAPPAYRGRLAGMFQFNIVFGIIIAFVSNAVIAHFGDANAWRWMLGIAAIPSIIYATMCFGIPESPRWLLSRKGDREAGLKVLELIEPDSSPAQLKAHADELMAAAKFEKTAASAFWTWRLRVPILLAFLVAFFNQLSGINAVLYFAPRIFEMTGLGEKAALLQSVGIGITNLIFTFVGLWLIDRLGRRTLLFIGSFGYIASLGLTAWAFFTQHYAIVPACIFAFIASHAVGQGAVIWVLISEIFPNRHRAEGQT
jgi:sugar porter (SP) family MFS transporter